jgi:hypothetical protein
MADFSRQFSGLKKGGEGESGIRRTFQRKSLKIGYFEPATSNWFLNGIEIPTF